jgi:oligopeptide transport system substrate-binding protein
MRRALLLGLLLPLLAGCGGRRTAVDEGVRTQVLHRGSGPDIADLDPHLATGAADYNVLSALFEGLVAEHPGDLRPVPGVAERWTVSDDERTYTFHLRSDARWSNGDPVTAQDFLDSWQRALTPSLAADNAGLMHVVRGAAAYHQGRTTDFREVGFFAPDARTVRVVLEHPTPHFLSLLQHWIWWPVHLPTLRRLGPVHERGNRWTRPETFVGNGPFVLEEWRVGQRFVVRRSPTYWDAARVRLSAIHLYPIEDVNAEERAFRAGQLHLTDAVPVTKIDAWRAQSPERLRVDPYLGTYFFRLNVADPFLRDVRVRRALGLTIDRTAIVERIMRGEQAPAGVLTPPGIAGYRPPAGFTLDPAAARALLAEAGFPGGRGAPVVDLIFHSSENHRAIAEALQEMWRRELGLDIRLTNMETKSALEARRARNYQILRSAWIADFADPVSFLSVWRGDGGNNHTGWSNPDFDRLLDEAARTPDADARHRSLQAAEALLLAEAPILPVFHYTHVFLIHPAVRGWLPNPLDHHPYKHVWLEAPP